MNNDAELVKGEDVLGFDLLPEKEYKVKVYDFKRPDKFSLEQIRTIRIIHETFARLATVTLSSILRRSVSVKLELVDQCAFYEYMGDVAPDGAVAVVGLQPLKGTVLMEFTPPLANALVNGLYGDPQAATKAEPFSEVDRLAVGYAAEHLLSGFRDAWGNVIQVSPDVRQVESDPEYAQIVPPTEMIILVALEVLIGDEAGAIRFAIPYLTIEPIISKLSAQYWYSSVRRGPAPQNAVQVSHLPVSCEVIYRSERLSLADLREVAEGRPVRLLHAGDGATLVLGGVPAATLLPVDTGRPVATRCTYRVAAGVAEAEVVAVSAKDGEDSRLDALVRTVDRLSGDIRQLSDSQKALSADLTDEPEAGRRSSGMEAATVGQAQAIATNLSDERPQTAAFVVSLAEDPVAAAVLSLLPEDRQPEVVERLVRSVETDEILRHRVSHYMSRIVSQQLATRVTGGPERAARILNNVPMSVERHIMTALQADNPPLFESIARLMFVFEDFVLVDGPAIRKLMSRISPEEMGLALKAAPQEVKDHILDALDNETARAIRDAQEAAGRVRRRDVESVQRDIIEELRQLEEAGEVVVARPEEMLE